MEIELPTIEDINVTLGTTEVDLGPKYSHQNFRVKLTFWAALNIKFVGVCLQACKLK